MNDGNLMILAAGISSRMKRSASSAEGLDSSFRLEAASKSKAMIGIGDSRRPLIDYLLYNAKVAGYDDILIVISEKDDSMRNYFGGKDRDNLYHKLRISFAVQTIPQGRSKPLGTADAVLQGMLTRKDWRGRKFTVCNSDNLYSVNALRTLLECGYSNGMIDYDRDALDFDQARIEAFSVTEKDGDGFLISIIEKPKGQDIERIRIRSASIRVSMNIFRLDYDMVLPFVTDTPLHSVRQEKELPMAVTNMTQRYPKSVFAFPFEEAVPDFTTVGDVARVRQYISKTFSGKDWESWIKH